MANKVRYGLRNSKYAIFDPTTHTYGTVKDFKGAVSLTLTREGGDAADFYADDGIYFTFAGTNGGYSADFEVARVTATIRRDILGEIADVTTGVQYETTSAEPPQFALITEVQGNEGPTGFVFYNCKASRPEMTANTKNDNPTVDTDTLNLRISAQDFVINEAVTPVVQGHIEKTSDNTSLYNAFFSAVTFPGTISA